MISEKEYINRNIFFILKSEIRLNILSELNEKSQSIADIVNKTNMAYSSVSSNMHKLEFYNHVKRIGKIYEINPMTRIYINQIIEFKKSIDVVKNFDNFWNKHDIKYINNESIEDITYLYESKLIETSPIEIYKTHDIIKNQLKESNNIKAILPYIHPDYPQLIEEILKNNGQIDLVINRTIYKSIIQNMDKQLRHDHIKKGNLKITLQNNSLEIYLLICDNTMNLGLFKNDGSYDQNRILNSNSEKVSVKNFTGLTYYPHIFE